MDDPDMNMTEDKPKVFPDQRQSSTDESQHYSAGSEPEPSTEQSSGTAHMLTYKHFRSAASTAAAECYTIDQLTSNWFLRKDGYSS